MKPLSKTIVVLSILALLFCTITVNAADNAQTASALLTPQRTILYNGVEQIMHDANGERVYPLSYQDTTYLPIRAVCNMLGLNVEWHGDTDTVSLLKEAENGGAQESETARAASADVIYRTVDAMNAQDWDKLIDLQSKENQQDYRNFMADSGNAEKHAGLFNILSAEIIEMKELPLEVASGLTKIDSF